MNKFLSRSAVVGFFALSFFTGRGEVWGALIRSFDSLPAGDVIGTGGALTAAGAPGDPSFQFNNTAAPGWGQQATSYSGYYNVGNANLIGALGTSSLSQFTLAYAYKPDIPNDPDKSARQFAIRPPVGGSGSETLAVSLGGHRQLVEINGISLGLPPAAPAARLMDGDPLSISDPQTGACCSTQSEWVFFAMTYQVLIPGAADKVTMYGFTASEASKGLQQIHTLTGNYNDAVDLTGKELFLGNTGFSNGTSWRPADSSFDGLLLDSRAYSKDELEALGKKLILGVPEPTAIDLIVLGGSIAVVMTLGRLRWRKSIATNPAMVAA